MSWPVPFEGDRISLHVSGRISEEDARRQTRTAGAILERLQHQPGVILADEVGMGKTFVALAVAASAVWADRKRRPVVVMVPPSLKDKWPRDFETFKLRCLTREEDRSENGLRAKLAANGLEFFQLLDDPLRRRSHIIFLPHGALHRGLTDPWTKLAILKQALRAGSLGEQRAKLPKWAAEILRCSSRHRDNAHMFERLLATSSQHWREILNANGEGLEDDPVPRAIRQVLKRGRVDLADLRERLRELPLRSSKHLDERLQAVRRSLGEAIRTVWQQALKEARFRSPLLILDEAHHLKNPSTKLASLFVDPEADEDAHILSGALSGGFERMLFLTATPFELGHHELLNVIDRFRGIAWKPGSPAQAPEDFDRARRELASALDQAHGASHRLDQRWSRVRPEHVVAASEGDADLQAWWQRVSEQPEEAPEVVQSVLRAHRAAADCMRQAEERLKPWVIRHGRPATLPGSSQERRAYHRGAAIAGDGMAQAGLEIRQEALLPFLLAARTQAVVARRDGAQASAGIRRATFAEGLASSYEAFLETRHMREAEAGRLRDEERDDEAAAPAQAGHVHWYLERLRGAIPADNAYEHHPKVLPTIQRACALWESGEKTLIFCHWRATGTALARHLSSEIARRIQRLGAQKLGRPESEVADHLRRLGDRFESDRPLYAELERVIRELVVGRASTLGEEHVREILTIVQRFVRTPSFLVRFFPLDLEDPNKALESALHHQDASGLTLRAKIESFVDFLAHRCEPELRAEYLAALGEIRTGTRKGGREDAGDEGFDLQPTVRRATGADDAEQRRRALLGFNTPFFPEILVASSVLAEGVDLHLDCRHVIHHDLGWNPSHLEQRTGRVDRIGSKAERVTQPIHVYLPYVAETQDEKMYRVVRDRERWFQVLMGNDYAPDETLTDRLSARIPLPEAAARELVFRLEV